MDDGKENMGFIKKHEPLMHDDLIEQEALNGTANKENGQR